MGEEVEHEGRYWERQWWALLGTAWKNPKELRGKKAVVWGSFENV